MVKRLIEKTKPGETLPLRVRRGDEARDVSVRLMSVEEFLRLDGMRRDGLPATTPTTAPASSP